MAENPADESAEPVLIVDDEPSVRNLLGRAVERAGGRPFLAENTARAKELLKEREYVVALIDKNLPDGTGLEILKLLKDRHPATDASIVTGFGNAETAVEARRIGATDYILKPFDIAGLVEKLRATLKRHREPVEGAFKQLLLETEGLATLPTFAVGVAQQLQNPLAHVSEKAIKLADALPQLQQQCLNLQGSDWTSDQNAALTSVWRALGELKKLAVDVRDGTELLQRLANDLRVFARTEQEKLSPADLRMVLDATVVKAWGQLREKCRVHRDYTAVPLVETNEGRLSQVFNSLILHCAQSFGNRPAAQNELHLSLRTDGPDKVVVTFRDNGPGMTEDKVGKLFDPFDTSGTANAGMGLSFCNVIITALGGEITCASLVGSGTKFMLVLPVVALEKGR